MFYFVITVLIIMATVYFALMAVLAFSTQNKPNAIDFFSFQPELLVGVILSVGVVIASGSLYQTWLLSGDGSSVAVQLGGIKVLPNTRNLEERILLNVVEEMALASGTPVPPVYVLENEQGINAFAAGTTPQNAVVGVTRGCIETLSRDELQGVIAHEFSHILNGDMKLNIRLIGLLHGILLIAMLGYGLFRIASQMPVRSSGKDDDAKAKAEEVRGKIIAGEPFPRLAADYSDSGSKANGGLVGPLSKSDLSEDLQKALAGLKEGGITPVLRTARGYQVVKIENLQDSKTKPFDEAKNEIADKIANDKRKVEFDKFLDKLRTDAIIDWKNDDLKTAYDLGVKTFRGTVTQ